MEKSPINVVTTCSIWTDRGKSKNKNNRPYNVRKVADGTANSPYFFSNPETPNFEYPSCPGCHSGEANI